MRRKTIPVSTSPGATTARAGSPLCRPWPSKSRTQTAMVRWDCSRWIRFESLSHPSVAVSVLGRPLQRREAPKDYGEACRTPPRRATTACEGEPALQTTTRHLGISDMTPVPAAIETPAADRQVACGSGLARRRVHRHQAPYFPASPTWDAMKQFSAQPTVVSDLNLVIDLRSRADHDSVLESTRDPRLCWPQSQRRHPMTTPDRSAAI